MPILALAAAILLMFAGGLFYCWSVFVAPFEQAFGASRGLVSLTFSIGLLALPLGSFAAAPLFRRIPLPALCAGLGILGAGGLALAGLVHALAALVVGFGVFFALAVGAAYALALQAASGPLPVRPSIAVSLAVSAFAGAGLVWPAPLTQAIEALGPHDALIVCAAAYGLAGLVSALLLRLCRAVAPATADPDGGGLFRDFLTRQPRLFALMWLGFAFLSLGGLMAIGHAAGIAQAFGVAAPEAYRGPMVVSFGYLLGSLASGVLSDRFTGRRVLIGLGIVMAGALAALLAFPGALVSLVVLALVGSSFGATAAVYPLTIPAYYGVAPLARVYGRIMLAYGAAGLAAPLLAGWLYDREGGYGSALAVAAAMAGLSVAANFLMPGTAPKPARA